MQTSQNPGAGHKYKQTLALLRANACCIFFRNEQSPFDRYFVELMSRAMIMIAFSAERR